MNISKETIEELEKDYTITFQDDYVNEVSPEKATHLHISWAKGEGDMIYIGKSIKVPLKKEVTLDYIFSKLHADSVYKNFSEYFSGLLDKYGQRVSAYPTSYGIGIFVAIGYRDQIPKAKQTVEALLTQLGIKYSTEYSDRGWVFRYKISKSAENIQQIERAISGEIDIPKPNIHTMITARNYFDHVASLDIGGLPETLRRGHDYLVNTTKNGSDYSMYESAESIKRVIDLYVGKLNEYLSTKGGASAEHVAVKNVMVDLAEKKVINHNGVPVFADDIHDLLDKFREAIGEKYGIDPEELHEVESAANDEERKFLDQIVDALPDDNGEKGEAPVSINIDKMEITTANGTEKYDSMLELHDAYILALSEHYELTEDDENPMSPYDNFSEKEQANCEIMSKLLDSQQIEDFAEADRRISHKLGKFLPKAQRKFILELSKSGFKEYEDEIFRLNSAIEALPALYAQDGKDAIVRLHYFSGNSHWWITEYDWSNDLAFGFTVINGDTQNAELGYMSIKEIISAPGVELDFHWKETTLSEAKEKKFPGAFEKPKAPAPAAPPKAKTPDEGTKKKENKNTRTKPEETPAPAPEKKTKFSDATPTEREKDSVKFIRRFVSLHDKKKTRQEMQNFIDSLQRAITERRITKDDPYAVQITYIQQQLIKGFNWMLANRKQVIEVVLSKKELSDLTPIAYSEQQALSVRFLKRYISLDGKTGVKDKAKKLYADIETAEKSGKLEREAKFAAAIREAKKNLKEYISGKSTSMDVWSSELNGIKDFFVDAGKRIATGTKRLIEKAAPHVKRAASKAGNAIKSKAKKVSSDVKLHVKKKISERVERKIAEEDSRNEQRAQERNNHYKGVKYIMATPKEGGKQEVSAVLFSKQVWGSDYGDMGEWLAVHGLKFSVPENSFTVHKGGKDKSPYWIIRQHPKTRYIDGTFKTVPAAKGLGFIFPAVAAAVTSTLVTHAMKKNGIGSIGEIENPFDRRDFEEVDKILEKRNEACVQVAVYVKSPYSGNTYIVDPCIKSELRSRGWQDSATGGNKKPIVPIKPRNGLFTPLDQLSTEGGGVFRLKGDIGEFVGGMERNEMAISIEGDEGSGKTQFMFQLADAFAEENIPVWILELEKSPQSANIADYRNKYVKPYNQPKIVVTGSLKTNDTDGLATVRKHANDFGVIMFDSWGKTNAGVSEFGELRAEFPNVIFVSLFQRRPDKIIRGGNEPKYDADINITVVKVDDTFINNYAITTKTRYGESGKKYNIIYKAIL